MGNLLALCTVGDIQSKEGLLKEKRTLQIIKVDGKMLEFKSPVIVRDLLVSYPDFYVGVFKNATQALPLDYKLKIGEIYYLLPSVTGDHTTTTTSSSANDEDARTEMDSTTTKTTTTTIKVVITKEQLQQILCSKQGRMEELLLGVVANKKVWSSENCSSSTWFPKLESIPEGSCDVVC
ncbi:hypothetical protein RDABS01_013178 [Bienertia sinuspersici]